MATWTPISESSAATLSATSKSAVATFINSSRNVKTLWAATTFPWQESAPWQIDSTGAPWTSSTKN